MDDDSLAFGENGKFRDFVFEFIQRLEAESSVYEDYECTVTSADFTRIELQLQTERIERILDLCIQRIQLVFHLSYLIDCRPDDLAILFAPTDSKQIERMSTEWEQFSPTNTMNSVFQSSLNNCLDIVEHNSIKWKKHKVTQNCECLIKMS